jgi:2-oxoglutarate ferredoxin oxidoreductase subunit beta
VEGRGFSLVEVLCNCPTQWNMSPMESLKWIDEKMVEHYPLGVFVDRQE